MGIFVRSIYEAVFGIWRMVILLPVLVPVVLVVAGLLSIVFAPFAILIGGVGITFIGLVTIRSVLAAHDHYTSPDLNRLIGASLKYTLLNGFVFIVVFILIGLILVLGLRENVAPLRLLAVTDLAGQWAIVKADPILLGVLLFYFAFMLWFYAAMMVPQAAAAWSASEKIPPMDFFWGFGSGFTAIAAVIAASAAIQTWFDAPERLRDLIGMGTEWLESKTRGRTPQPVEQADLIRGLIGLGIIVLTFYWQYVVAALAFIERRKWVEDDRQQSYYARSKDWVDPRELRNSRRQ